MVLGVFAHVFAHLFAHLFIKVKEAALRIGEGQLNVEIEAESKDEFGQLTTTFN